MAANYFLPFNSEAEAVARSASLMTSKQSPVTQADPRTVTKYFFRWSTSPTSSRSALVVPPLRRDELSRAERDTLLIESEALAADTIRPRIGPDGILIVEDAVREPESGQEESTGGTRNAR